MGRCGFEKEPFHAWDQWGDSPPMNIRRAKRRGTHLDGEMSAARSLVLLTLATGRVLLAAEPLQITSHAFQDGAVIPAKFTAGGADTTINLPAGADRAGLDRALNGHAVAQAVLMGLCSR